jgi:hypothetical protein
MDPAYDLAAMRMRRRFGRYAHAHTIGPLHACADDLTAKRMRRRTDLTAQASVSREPEAKPW